MSPELTITIAEVAAARARVVASVGALNPLQAHFKPSPAEWSIVENLEHLVLAEHSGLSKIWQAAEAYGTQASTASADHPNRGLSIEEVVDRTWKAREIAPPIATPHIGGPLAYWITFFLSCQGVLERLADTLDGLDLESVIFPHFLSGPLDARQRLAFLRFHIDRHLAQIERVKRLPGFPR